MGELLHAIVLVDTDAEAVVETWEATIAVVETWEATSEVDETAFWS